jgi:hypothetical protein
LLSWATLPALAMVLASCTSAGGSDAVEETSSGDLAVESEVPSDSQQVPANSQQVPANSVATDNPAPNDEQPTSGSFEFSFDGDVDMPTPFNAPGWEVTVHSRDVDTLETLELTDAAHGPACEPPPASHPVTAYEDAVYLCKDHMMTAMNASGYGMIYLTPDRLVDFSHGEAVIRVDISTLRTSVRDWWDIWITPFDDNLQLPLDLANDVDAAGPPRRAIRIGLGTENQIEAELYVDHMAVDFGVYPENQIPALWGVGYESFLEPGAKRRDTFEVRLSKDHLKVGMPEYDFWWIDEDLPELDWSSGVVQFGHHSYNPTKGCGTENNPAPAVESCVSNTWHWDNVIIDPSIPFDISVPDRRRASPEEPIIELAEPVGEGGELRFTAIGEAIRVRFDDDPWTPAVPQQTLAATPTEHFTSYWMEIPAGTSSVTFTGTEWFEDPWLVRDVSVWAPPVD